MNKKVVLITTGGTIASKRNKYNKLESGKLNGQEILNMCHLENDIEIELIDLFQLPSMHISFENLNQLSRIISEKLSDDDVLGVVVTHGTDTLEETAYFLELTTNSSKPIIVTGSQKSPDDVGTDVYTNLRDSILVAKNPNSVNLGVVVVFNEQILQSKYVRKIHSSSINGFGAIGYGKLGFIDNGDVIINQKPYEREYYDLKETYPPVEIIYSYLGASDFLLNVLNIAGITGVVLIGGGRGQVSIRMVDAIDTLLEKGTKIVLVTSSKEGRVYPTYDYLGSANRLKSKGVIMGGDFDAKKARIKLMLQLANKVENYNTYE